MKFRSRVFSLDAAPCFLVEYEITCSSEVTLPSCPRALLTTSTPPSPPATQRARWGSAAALLSSLPRLIRWQGSPLFALMKPQWKDRASAGSSDTAVKLQSPFLRRPPCFPPSFCWDVGGCLSERWRWGWRWRWRGRNGAASEAR